MGIHRPITGLQKMASRRSFIGAGAMAAAATVFGPSVVVACSSNPGTGPATAPLDDGTPATGSIRVSNWPLYIAEGFVADFERSTGLSVRYNEDYTDDETWFAKVKDPLSRRQDIGCDLVIPSDVINGRLIQLGWLNEIREARWPNKSNLQPALLDSSTDPGRKMTAPYMNGISGLAYNRAATGRDITRVDDLWDPAFRGRVSLLSDMRDALGMIMLSQGDSPATPTTESVQKAVDNVREQKDKGQIRRFTGADYGDDLAAGNTVIAQAYSGDVNQLIADNPDLRFAVPESGSTTTLQSMVIPYTTQNQAAAEEWINYVYDRPNYAKLVAYTQYLPVLTDMGDELAKIDPALASNPLVNPPQDLLSRLIPWHAIADEEDKQFTDMYTAVTGA